MRGSLPRTGRVPAMPLPARRSRRRPRGDRRLSCRPPRAPPPDPRTGIVGTWARPRRRPAARTRAGPIRSRPPGSCAASTPARPAGSRPPGSSTSTATARWRSSRPFYSTFVFDATGHQLGKGHRHQGPRLRPGGRRRPRRRRGHGDRGGRRRGHGGGVRVPQPRGSACKPGWPASTRSGGQCPEARGMAAADLDGDGKVEVVVTTTNTSDTGAQVFVFNAARQALPAAGRPLPGVAALQPAPRRRERRGLQRRGQPRLRRYGENVGIGNIDDDPELEIIVTYDNHQINAFNPDGTSVLASPWFTNPRLELPRAAAGLGPVHPLGRPDGRGAPLPPAHGRVARASPGRCGCSGPPRRRRSPTSTATARTRSSASPTPR